MPQVIRQKLEQIRQQLLQQQQLDACADFKDKYPYMKDMPESWEYELT